jgi:hypothetical protein
MTEQAHGQHLAETFLFFAAVPDLSGSLAEAADDHVVGDVQVLHWVRRRVEHARRLVRTVTESLIATINHKETT